jgi:hypothetical protein
MRHAQSIIMNWLHALSGEALALMTTNFEFQRYLEVFNPGLARISSRSQEACILRLAQLRQ